MALTLLQLEPPLGRGLAPNGRKVAGLDVLLVLSLPLVFVYLRKCIYGCVYIFAGVVEAEREAECTWDVAAVAVADLVTQLVYKRLRNVEQVHQVGVRAEAANASADSIFMAEDGCC